MPTPKAPPRFPEPPRSVVRAPKAPTPQPIVSNVCTADPKKCSDLRWVLEQAGFTGEGLKTAFAVAMAESGGRPDAFNGKGSDLSYGLFQINMLGKLGPARRDRYGLSSNEELYDPINNAKIAYEMSGGGKNWRPWSAYSNHSYRKYLNAID